MQCDPLFIGISRRDLNVRPTAFFYIKCSLGSEEIRQLYSRAQDGYESTDLYTVSKVRSSQMLYVNVAAIMDISIYTLKKNEKSKHVLFLHTDHTCTLM